MSRVVYVRNWAKAPLSRALSPEGERAMRASTSLAWAGLGEGICGFVQRRLTRRPRQHHLIEAPVGEVFGGDPELGEGIAEAVA